MKQLIQPYQAINRQQLIRSLQGRKMITKNNVKDWYYYSIGESKDNNTSPLITKPMYNLLDKIVSNLTYKNIYIGDRSTLSSELGCTDKHLTEVLTKLTNGFIKIEKSMKNNLRILIHPVYGYKYNYQGLDADRERMINYWIKDSMKDVVSPLISGLVVNAQSPNSVVKDAYDKWCEDKSDNNLKEYLLAIKNTL